MPYKRRVIGKTTTKELDAKLSRNQYGFRKKTVDAITAVLEVRKRGKERFTNRKFVVLITLDIRNPSNSAPWDIIMEE